MAFGQLIEELETQLKTQHPDFARCDTIVKELKVYYLLHSHINISKAFFQ